jgi:protein-disulfide isomerase
LPTYLLGEELINIEIDGENGEKISMKNVMSEVLDSVNGFWKIKAEAMNFAVGKYLNGLDIDEKGDFKIGNGPVKVIEFSDFQCPYCQKFYLENNEQIMKLVADGRITYLFKDFPLRFHKESFAFHEVAGCIVRKSNSDIYKKFVNEVFTRKDEWENKTGQEMKSILKFLGNTGITEKDQKAVLSCYEKGESKEDITEDIAEGKDFGVGGTPTIFVGERKLPGAVSPAVLLEAVELAEKDLKE